MNFITPAFLWGALAVGIPIFLHLFNLQKPKKVYFTNVGLLKNIQEKTQTSRQIRHILILICRCLFILFLTLAFAQPFIAPTHQHTHATKSVSVYIDNSYSMQNKTGAKTLLDACLITAGNLIQIFPPSTQYLYLDNGFLPTDKMPLTADKFKDRLTETTLMPGSRTIEQILQKHAVQNLSYASADKALFLFSDFQKSTLGQLPALLNDTNTTIFIAPTQAQEQANAYVDSVWIQNFFIKPNEPNRLFVKIKNSGAAALKNLHIKLLIDSVQTGLAGIDIAANNEATLSFDFMLTDSKLKKCTLVLDDSPVSFDNQYFFTLRASPAIHVLSVGPGENKYLKAVFNNPSVFKHEYVTKNALTNQKIEKADLITIEEADTYSSAEWDRILKIKKSSATLLLIPSSSPSNQSIYVWESTFGMYAQVTPQVTDNHSTEYTLSNPDIRNPFFSNIFEHMDKNMEMPYALPVWTPTAQIKAHLKCKNDYPFLIQQKNVFFLTTPIANSHTNFHKNALFVPVMYKMAIQSVQNNPLLSYHFNQRNIVFNYNEANASKSIKIKFNDRFFVPEQTAKAGKWVFDIPAELYSPGYYALYEGDSLISYIAINTPKAESIFNFYTLDELKTWAKAYPNVKVAESPEGENLLQEVKAAYIGIALWKYCIAAALFFLLCEVLLIRFFKK